MPGSTGDTARLQDKWGRESLLCSFCGPVLISAWALAIHLSSKTKKGLVRERYRKGEGGKIMP